MDPASKAKITRRINDWKLKLIDLSRRNKLINFTPTKSSSIQIIGPEINVIFERLVVKNRPMEMWMPLENVRGSSYQQARKTQLMAAEVDPRQLERTLRNLSRRSVSEYRERGVRILYVSFGMLALRDEATDTTIKSPIILTPIEITRKTSADPYRIQVPVVEDEIVINPALTLKLQNDHKINLPPLPDFETETLSKYLQSVEEKILSMGWELDYSVQIGLFSFQKLVMYQDLNDNVEMIAENPIVQALAGVTNRSKVLDSLPKEEELDLISPKQTFQVLDADSSQQLCIQYALAGQSFVMHGPPGTGKSQTIANLISEFIAKGKSVLFVSEKMAALEVVYNRLKAKNLDDYCLELHSQKANKREVVVELNRCLTEHLREWSTMTDDELEKLVNRRMQLNAYVEALHKLRANIDLTAYQLLCMIAKLEGVAFVPSNYNDFRVLSQKKFLELEDYVRKISNDWVVVEQADNFPWKGCVEDSFSPETRSSWIYLLDTTLSYLEELITDSANYSEDLGITAPKTIRDYERLRTLTEIISKTPKPPRYWLEDADLKKIKTQAEANRQKWGEYRSGIRDLKKRYDTRFLVLPQGTAERINRAFNELRVLLLDPQKGDGGLLLNKELLNEYLKSFPDFLQLSSFESRKISDKLGVKDEIMSLNDVMRVSELTQLCQEAVRPPRLWLEKKILEDVKNKVESLKNDYAQKKLLRDKLADYEDSLLLLDLDKLINYFEGPGKSFFRFLSPTYSRNKSIISSVRKDQKPGNTILNDLRVARELKKLLDKLESEKEDYTKTLGAYYRDDGELDDAEKAFKIAARVIQIFGTTRVPKALRDNLCFGTEPSEELIQVSLKLQTSLSTWNKTADKLKALIPSRRLPNTAKSIRRSSIKEVEEWAVEASERLNQLERVSAEALTTRIGESTSSFTDLLADLKHLEGLQSFEVEVGEELPNFKETFGGLYNGLDTDWDEVLSAIGWTVKLIRTQTLGLTDELKDLVSEGGEGLPPDPMITERWDRISRLLVDLKDRFNPPLITNPDETLDLNNLKDVVQRLRDNIDELQAWVDYKSTSKLLEKNGLGVFLNRVVTQRTDKETIVDVFKKSIYQGLLDMFFEEDQDLKNFRGRNHEQLIKDFQELDRRFIQLTSQRVIENANKNKPQGVFVQAPDSEITILMREAAKKRRHIPLRELFDKVPNLIRRLKPCLMMSPISVSQFLMPGGLQFDLVVFDEASQIYTEDAIGSIYRGNELVVAGDPKQLPPTPFFQTTMSDDFDWDEESYDFDLFESVLDECMSIGLPVKMLRWHYRSKHDSLISFSNDRFYDGRLVLFPASRMGADDLGVEFVHVQDGIYDRGGARDNLREAEVVTDIVFDHYSKHPDKTLGIVTFSIAQMNKVQDCIDQRLKANPTFEKFFTEDRLNGFFVKNLENVQGDERDIIIFSVGYGYDSEGKITMNFGPLNKSGGERRLNVAITRAREKVILVSSIRYDDISSASTDAQGVDSLRSYLRYAEKRPRKLEAEKTEVPYGYHIELDVAEEIERLGYETVPWVGSSTFRVDLGVVDKDDPSRFMLGIMCDGEGYKSASTARDRDRLRLQVLESLGWRVHRIWSPDWVQRRTTEISRIEGALKQAEKNDSIKSIRTSTINYGSNKIAKLRVMETPVEQLPEFKPYKLARFKTKQDLNKYHSDQKDKMLKKYHSEVKRLLPQLVNEEGPIHEELAFSRINSVLKVGRTTNIMREAFAEEIKKGAGGLYAEKGEFLWPLTLKSVQVRVPIEGVKDSYRSISHIPPEEALQAMLTVAKHSFGLSYDSLINKTANVLGFMRLGSNIKETLSRVYTEAEKRGLISLNDGVVIFKRSV